MHRFVKELIRFTQSLNILRQNQLIEDYDCSDKPSISWHGVVLNQPDWSDDSHSLAFSLRHPAAGEYLHVILNAYWEPLEFELPLLDSKQSWKRIVNTFNTPDDISPAATATMISPNFYRVEPRSAVVLMAS